MVKSFGRSYLPTSKLNWKLHFKFFLPMLLGGVLFALNGFVDNFMVGHIEQGVTALSAVNAWTSISYAILSGVGGAGAIVMAQFYYSGHYQKVKEIARLRFLVTIGLTSILAITAWVFPDQMINVFLKNENTGSGSYIQASKEAHAYLRIIAIQWVLITLTGNFGNMFSETKYGYVMMYWGIGTLLTNIVLNSIFMYGIGMDVSGAAWASVFSRFVALGVAIIWLYKEKMKIAFKPWTIFKISKRTWILFLKRWYVFLASFLLVTFLTSAYFFYDIAYPVSDKSKLGVGLSAMMIIGLVGAIQNVFTSTFDTVASMSSIFVGSEQGNKNFDQAKANAKILKGFITLISIGLAILLAIFAACVPWMTFLSRNAGDAHNINHVAHLRHVRNSLWVIAMMYPFWSWFHVSLRTALTGGKGFWFVFTDLLVTGPIHLSYLAFLSYWGVQHWDILQSNFSLYFGLSLATDFIDLIIIEILFYKTDWVHSLVHKDD